jgi:hypothetical protein
MSIIRKSFIAAAFTSWMHIVRKVTLCGVYGSLKSSFSLAHCTAPLLGFFCASSTIWYAFILRSCITYLVQAQFSLYLPTLGGTLWLSSKSRLFKMAVPALCIGLFASHAQASPLVTCYWIIPLILSFAPKRFIFLQALASTFTTHAVGSVLWLYTHNTDPLFWNALLWWIPFERLCYALILTTSYYGVKALARLPSPSFKRSLT